MSEEEQRTAAQKAAAQDMVRVLEGDATDVPPDVRQLTERVRWAVLTLR